MRFPVDAAFHALARFVVRFRFPIVLFWVLVAIVTSAALPSLSSEVDNNNSAFLPSSAPSQKAANLATPVLGGGGSNGGQLRAIGFGLAIGILMDTFLVRTLLVPSTVMLLGRFNWWPSAMGRVDQSRSPALPLAEADVS